MPSEERVMRAREWIARHYPGSVDTAGADRLVAAFVAGAAFSDEGSGIGELLSAIDAWIADGTPETEQGVLDARARFYGPDIDRSGLAQEVE